MKNILSIALLTSLSILFSGCHTGKGGLEKSESYTWKNVRIVGGGFVDGFVYHPAEKGLVYARTDMGGAYRRDSAKGVWRPLMDWVSFEDVNLMGIESIALDPNDPNKLYMACGTYSSDRSPVGEILRSPDRGETFHRTTVPFKMGGNENGRGNGERMTVDPNNGNILYLGTRHDGLWKSTDGAVTWEKVELFPDIIETVPDTIKDRRRRRYWSFAMAGSGIVNVLCDPASGKTGEGSSDIYALVSLMNRDNFFRSTDGGSTWEAVPGQPVMYRPNHAVLGSDGNMIISYGDNPGPWGMKNGGVWKYNLRNGKWTDITPDKPDPSDRSAAFGYASVAVDPQHPDTILACSFYRPGDRGGEEVFRSTDGGQTWKGVFAEGGTFDVSKAPYVSHTGIHWLFDCEIDPFNPDHAMFTTGYGGHETFDLTNMDRGQPTVWSVMSTGIEETVPLDLLSPPKGPPLITAIGDYGGFVHWNLDKPVPEGNFTNPHFGNTDGLDCAWLNPDIIVRVGIESHGRKSKHNIGYSTDMGKTWEPTVSKPKKNSAHGNIAVSADGKAWIWTPLRSKPYLTTDKGASWEEISELPENTKVVADRVNPKRFYAVNIRDGLYYVSVDGGRNFVSKESGMPVLTGEQMRGRGDSRGGQDHIYAVPGIENEVWIAAYDGLYYKSAGDPLFTLMPVVEEIQAFGFGKAKKRSGYPAIYLVGVINGERGIFRSDDTADSWTRINDDRHQWGLILHVTGDPKKYGRVYVGTHGRGAVYGDPEETKGHYRFLQCMR